MKRIIAAALLALSAVSTFAWGQQTAPDPLAVTGNQFEMIFEGDPSMRELALAGMSRRVVEGTMALRPQIICPTQGATYLQGAKIVDLFIAQHPQFLNMQMGAIVTAALAQAFPCAPN